MEKEKLAVGFTKKLTEFIKSLGLELFGFTDSITIDRYGDYYQDRPPEFLSAFETGTMEQKCRLAGNYISIAFPYAHDLTQDPTAHFSVYTKGPDYHRIVREHLSNITDYIEDLGWTAKAYTDSNALPERLIAALAGLGYLGRNSTLITKEYGSFVFLGEINTDLPLVVNERYTPPGDYSNCSDCRNCIKACPVQILGKGYVDTGRCLSEVTQKKYHSEGELELLNGRLFGCDTCQYVCPHNQGKAGLGLNEFKPYDFMVRPNLEELIFMTKETFKAKYQLTSAGWRGKAVLAKNALAAKAKSGTLPTNWTFESPLVMAAYEKLLESGSKDKDKDQEKNEDKDKDKDKDKEKY